MSLKCKSDHPLPWPQLKPFYAHYRPQDKVHTLTYGLQALAWSNRCILTLTFTNGFPSVYNTSQSQTSTSHHHHPVPIALQMYSLENLIC